MAIWLLTVDLSDVFHNKELSFEFRRDEIVKRVRASVWITGGYASLEDILDNLADAQDAVEFDAWWDELYELADRDRVWIATQAWMAT